MPQNARGKTAASENTAHLSPNHQAKREEIVAAAVQVLLTHGMNACTVRAIAAQGGVSKSAVHYYFDDVEAIVDQAMLRATEAWVAWLQAGEGTGGSDPEGRFWQAVRACLEPFAAGDRSLLPLWMEYWAARSRQGRLAPLRSLQELLTGYVAYLLEEAGVKEPRERAIGVTAYLFGVTMYESLDALDLAGVERHIGRLAGIAPGGE